MRSPTSERFGVFPISGMWSPTCHSWWVAAVALVAVGSGYYHLQPNNATLVWDRLPMTLVFMAFFVAVLGERVHTGWARSGLVPALVVGILSVIWWHLSGDLRPYLLVQFVPVMLIPLVVLLYPSPLPRAGRVWGLIIAYLVAKALELLDGQVYQLLGVGGHALKHVVAAIGVLYIAAMVRARR